MGGVVSGIVRRDDDGDITVDIDDINTTRRIATKTTQRHHHHLDDNMTDPAILNNTDETTFGTWPLLTSTAIVAKNLTPYRAILRVRCQDVIEYINVPPQREVLIRRRFRGLPVTVMNDSGKFGSRVHVSAL